MLLNKRDSGHEKDYISFMFDPIAMKLCKDMCENGIYSYGERV